ncbi:hypothetical protein SERLA73DRAFT_69895 [Serpula lacrymans var. lacrymans S7.3]|uniref:F-box domain-containing protein n=2 Tax=Serpula lacrymans var. lacrymans TaxID=341189 RepID=F8PJH7_SERL3|nr:uncharacterized protein SERLADRAFT_433970 [Serpula lacrymans var. lacrymans S7.9]EGO04115.1 hypothetical protein SERLA73DRAFT_69895 [Serpula lacrymans var. lacrymans S7.3]EGO30042.1 hypothetical protein SERLADRAFT_433970 [Serpula lacrymans var. lacrymans S7.9]
MLPEDWSIFQRYTRRVRTFEFDIGDSRAPDVYRALSFLPTSSPLFPHLQRVIVRGSDNSKISDEVLHFVCLLFGQKLVHIDLGMERAEPPQLSLFMNLGNTCPFIKTASFGLIADSPSAVDALSGAVCCWDHLEELNCNFLNEKAICHLAGLNSLRSLTFRVPSSQMATYQGFDYPDDKPMLSNLQVLDLRFGNSLPVCATFISIIRSVPQRIHLSFNILNPPHLCKIFSVRLKPSANVPLVEMFALDIG